MSHFAKIDRDGIVSEVIVAEQEFIDSLPSAASWIQTSYNTRGGIHAGGGVPLRMNFASPGSTYDPVRDVFIPPRPHAGWILNDETCLWAPPYLPPEDGQTYAWNEDAEAWTVVTL